MVSLEYSEAMVEVLDILDNSDDAIYEKIPKHLIGFWQKNKSSTYKPKLDHSKPINEMILKDKTRDIITMIYLNYLCDDIERENTIKDIRLNEQIYQEELREKYNPNDIFKKRNQEKNEDTIKDLVVVKAKESIFTKIINSIKKFFRL